MKQGTLILFVICAGLSLPALAEERSGRETYPVTRIRIQPMTVQTQEDGSVIEKTAEFPALCSGFVLKTQPRVFVTAGHCHPDSIDQEMYDMGIDVDKYYFVVDEGLHEIESVPTPIQPALTSEIAPHRISLVPNIDMAFFVLSEPELPDTPEIELAFAPPQYGDPIQVTGYPGGFGPVSISCRYVGVGLRTLGSYFRLTTAEELECPELASLEDDLGGISGGLVTNEQGRVVGIAVQQMQGSSPGEFTMSTMTRISFVPLTQQNTSTTDFAYQASQWNGHFESLYLDWTTGKEVMVKYNLLGGLLNGAAEIVDTENNEVIESWELEDGYWSM
jgi:hypothetical protein